MDPAQHASAHRAFRAAVEKAGNQSEFGRATGAKQQNVSNWLRRGALLPGEFVLATERTYGISRHDLRPDLYPRETPAPRSGAGLDAIGASR